MKENSKIRSICENKNKNNINMIKNAISQIFNFVIVKT